MSAQRGGRGPKGPKTVNQQISKAEAKNAATQEQMRIAQLINDHQATEPEIKEKVEQIVEMTGRNEDEVLIALHDCGYQVQQAVERLLENANQGEWHATKTKKKKTGTKGEPEPVPLDKPEKRPNGSASHSDLDWNPQPDRGGSAPRGRRNDKAPPRFQRAARAKNQNEDDRGDSKGRGRSRGGSRGPVGASRSRGRGRRDVNGFRSGFDGGPEIDTWTNEVAANKENVNSFGTWGEPTEDWGADEWTGSLEESKVFTPSVPPVENKVTDGVTSNFTGDNDAQMFSVSNIETQVFNNSSSGFGDSTFQETQQSPQKLGQRLDINMLLAGGKAAGLGEGAGAVGELTPQTANFMSEFAKQTNEYNKAATESLKNAVGIGNANSSQQPSSDLSANSSLGAASHQPVKMKRIKQPQASKIPSSAVVMPGGATPYAGLDVQFGNWEKEDPFSFGSVPVNATSSVPLKQSSGQPSGVGGPIEASNSASQPSQAVSSLFNSMNQPQVQSQQQKSVMHAYSKGLQSSVGLQQSSMISTKPDVLQYSGQATDRKSPYQSSGSLQQADMSGTTQLYPQQQPSQQQQADYTSNYSSSSSAYKNLSSAPATRASLYPNPPPSGSSQSGLQNYNSSSFQASSGHVTGASHHYSGQQKLDSGLQHHASASSAAGVSYAGQGSSMYDGSTYQQSQSNAFGSSSGREAQGGSGYPGSGPQSLSGSGSFSQSLNQPPSNASYVNRDLGDSQYGSSSYSSGAQASLNAKLEKMSLKDSASDSPRYEGSSTMTSATTSHSPVASNQGLSGAGITALATSSSAMISSSSPSSAGVGSSSSKTNLGSSGRAPPNLPQGLPPAMMGQNYIMGQPGLGGIPLHPFGLQQPMYGYEDPYSQLRLPMHNYYDNLAAFQPTPTTLTGIETSKISAAMQMGMAGLDSSKAAAGQGQQSSASLSQRSDSPVSATQGNSSGSSLSQAAVSQAAATPAAAAAAQQQFINTNYPQGFYNYYPHMANNYYATGAPMIPFGNHMMPTVTNASNSSGNNQHAAQYPKGILGTYGTYGGGQSQDYKAYGGSQQSQAVKTALTGSLNTSGADLTGSAIANYPKGPNQSAHNFGHSGSAFEKLANSNPAAFGNLAGLTGNVAGSLHSQVPPFMANLPFVPNIHQQGAGGQMLPHALHQDGNSSGGRGQSGGQQSKAMGGKAFQAYWNSTN